MKLLVTVPTGTAKDNGEIETCLSREGIPA